ncbi:MAG: fumarate hydratase [Planctomycetes bacterium]|nr:fumarate hydratase [Planctomycetota bacterium]
MDTIYDRIETTARDLYIRALKDIPRDVRDGLQRAHAAEKAGGHQTAERVMFTILNNIEVADKKSMMVCQDTGLPVFKVSIGSEAKIDVAELKNRLRKGCERATAEYPLRSNTVHPLTRKHTGTNTGQGVPIVKLYFVPGSDRIEISMAPKGSGSENTSFLKMLNPSEGRKGVKQFILQCVFESGARPCPPIIVGVGLGGTSDVAMQLAKEASTFRKIGSANPDPDVAQLERELLEAINQTGIGPQGLGGATTAMAVHIEWAHTHISQNPVAVNMQCWRGERAEAVISLNETEVHSHGTL